ncbi:hypothetical protein ACWD6N_35810 [Micromonospora sp. NPDC005163]
MLAALSREGRVLRGAPLLWLLPVLVVSAAVLLMPMNADYYMTWVYYDPQTDYERLEQYYVDGVFSYTSGVLVGHLLALLFGAGLVLADHPPRRTLVALARWPDPGTAPPDPGTALPAKLVVAVLGGVAFALLNLVVTVPLAGAVVGTPPGVAEMRAAGVSFRPELLTDPGVRLAMLTGFGAYPLFAALGVGLAALLGRVWRVVTVVLLWWLTMLVPGFFVVGQPRDDAVLMSVVLLLVPPIAQYASMHWLALTGYEPGHGAPEGYGELAAVGLVVGVLAYAILAYLAGSAVFRSRLRRRAAAHAGPGNGRRA